MFRERAARLWEVVEHTRKRMRTLIAEDDVASRCLLVKLLGEHGETHSVTDGKEAIDAYEEAFQDNRPYDLVCLDVIMPEVDGHNALKAIRQFESENGVGAEDAVKILMVTSCADAANVMKALDADCHAYLVKPIMKATLAEHLRTLGLTDG